LTGSIARALALSAALLPAAWPAVAQQQGLPGPLAEVGFDQNLGESVPLDLEFTDHTGARIELRELFGERPIVRVPAYYECPMLCTLVLDGLSRTLRTLPFNPGTEFDVVTVSFDPRETPEQAAETRDEVLARFRRPETAHGWHFLTGEQPAIESLTSAVGFRYAFDEALGEYAHAAGVVVITPEGRIARYFFGIEYPARDLRLGLVEAADERIGSVVDQLLLYCYRYDPTTGRYNAVVMRILRLAGIATVLAIGIFLSLSWLRERRLRHAPRHA
jgi:protein SCO1/2